MIDNIVVETANGIILSSKKSFRNDDAFNCLLCCRRQGVEVSLTFYKNMLPLPFIIFYYFYYFIIFLDLMSMLHVMRTTFKLSLHLDHKN